jgi:ribonucleotide reductase alpha subunit
VLVQLLNDMHGIVHIALHLFVMLSNLLLLASQEFEPQFEKVRELFKGFEIPTAEDWKALQKDVEQYGLICII